MLYKKYIIILLIITAVILFIINKNKKIDENILPINLNKTHICANDSMIIINYKGPKAQIVWKNNNRSFFCEVREGFYESTNKIKNKNIKAFFVQNFDNLIWGSYINNWMHAENAYYVIDSNINGAMGLSYVPFKKLDNAKKFLEKYGGKIIKYKDINQNILSCSSSLLKDRII